MIHFFRYKQSLRQRFALTAALMLMPLAILVVVQYSVFNQTITNFNHAIEHGSNELADIRQLQHMIHMAIMAPNDYLIHGNKSEYKNYATLSNKVTTSINNMLTLMKEHQNEYNMVKQLEEFWLQIDNKANTIFAFTHPVGNAAAAETMENLDVTADQAASILEEIFSTATLEMKDQLHKAENLRVTMIFLIIGGTSISALLILWLNMALAKAVVNPLCCLKKAATQVGDGDYHTRLSWQRTDEIGELSQSFDIMTEHLEKARNELECLSRQDGLTGILNRREFDRLFRIEFSRAVRFGHNLSLIMIDIDHFKSINDEHGHLAGDNVLRILTTIVEKTIRDIDQFARYGGEEFTLILPEVDRHGACTLAERIRKLVEVANFGDADGNPVHITLSAGVADYPEHGTSEKDIIYAADKALYKAKHKGRNRVICAEIKTS